jgi:hypothetical protein
MMTTAARTETPSVDGLGSWAWSGNEAKEAEKGNGKKQSLAWYGRRRRAAGKRGVAAF